MKFMQRLALCEIMNSKTYNKFVEDAVKWHYLKYNCYANRYIVCYEYYIFLMKDLSYYKQF